MKYIGYIIIILLVILGVTFAVMNSNAVTIHYYFGKTQMALSLLMAISFATGIILGILVMLFKVMRLRFANGSLRRKLQRIEKESVAKDE